MQSTDAPSAIGSWPVFRRCSRTARRLGAIALGATLLSSGHLAERAAGGPVSPAAQASQTASAVTGCNASIETGFKPGANTVVTLVKSFNKGDALTLADPSAAPAAGGRGGAGGAPPIAANDVCVVKLVVGPGNPGPADAPSTTAGVAIEIWLPSAANWNGRVHMLGNGGCAGGGNVISTTVLGGTVGGRNSAAGIATVEGAVSAITDTGHTVNSCSFGLNPDLSINTVSWMDFSRRSLHEMATMTKALATAYYGSAPRYAYFQGNSTGGRQAHTIAQVFPDDVDGILAGAPAMNWTQMAVGAVYPAVVIQRDLDGVPLTSGQRILLGNAATDACDMVGGVHLGYILDPSTCTYDPTKDPNVLCVADGGRNGTSDCVTPLEAQAQNKMWYGPTRDGSVPPPATDNGWSLEPRGLQLWYGIARGANSGLASGTPGRNSMDFLTVLLGNPKLGRPTFVHATGNGEDGWKDFSYTDLANALVRSAQLQPQFGYIDTHNPDLTRLEDSGTKFIHYHGLADGLIPAQGSINYYNRVSARMGGFSAVQEYYRLYLVPAMAHGPYSGVANRNANPPIPTSAQLYQMLTDWVEKGIAPGRVDISTPATSPTAKSRPICPYPEKATYRGGDPNTASSYSCS